MGLIKSELYCFGIRIQKIVFIAFIGSEQTIYGLITSTLKKLLEQNLHSFSFISKRSFVCCGSVINFIVVAVFINCSNS